MKKIARLTIAPLVWLMATSAGAQTPTTEQRIDAIAREAARQFAAARLATSEQTRPSTPPPPAGTPVALGLEEAVARSLERNLDIAVERLNPRTFDFSISALEANYRPMFTTAFGMRSQSQFPRSQTAGAEILNTETLTGNTGFAQNVKWGGGSYSITFNNNHQEQSDRFATRNPTLNTNIQALYVQPLLRGFRIDTTRAQLRVTQLNQEISEIGLRATVVGTMANVRNAYWDFVFAVQAVEVAERSRALASKLVEDNRSRVEVGTMAPIDVVQAQAEEAVRRQTLAEAVATQRTAELALKRLIVSGTDDPLWTASLNPVDRPSFVPAEFDVAAAVKTALQNRTDLQQSQRTLEANSVSLRNLADQQLPALDLTASYGLAGVGGTEIEREDFGGEIASVRNTSYRDALGILGDRRAPSWNFALNLSYPLGTSAAQANHARARLEQQQTLAQAKQLELQIATEVTNAALQIEASRERLQAATASRELGNKRLEAEQSKFEVGMSTNFFVVQAQRDLADAENAELRALLDYRKAQVDFERVQEAPAARPSNGNVNAIAIGGGNQGNPRANAGTGGLGIGGGGGGS